MSLDPHELSQESHTIFQHRIDASLAGALSPRDERSLHEHLHSCAQCQEYLDASSRVIASLQGLSFAVDARLNARVHAALAQRARQVRARQVRIPALSRRWWAGSFAAAVVLTLLGSLADLRLSGVLAALFDIQPTQARHDLLSFWIAPSLCMLLVFPLLPLLTSASSAQPATETSSNWKGTIQ